MDGIRNGIAKVNIATAIRQPYERAIGGGGEKAKGAVHAAMLDVIRRELETEGSAEELNP